MITPAACPCMNRATLIRGIQLIVTLTLASFAYVLYSEIHDKQASLTAGSRARAPGLAARRRRAGARRRACSEASASGASGACSGPSCAYRTAVTSEFVLMFCAGRDPRGRPARRPRRSPSSRNGGMRLVDVATAELLTASAPIYLLPRLVPPLVISALQQAGIAGRAGGPAARAACSASPSSCGSALVALIAAAAYPPLLKGIRPRPRAPFGEAVLLPRPAGACAPPRPGCEPGPAPTLDAPGAVTAIA